MKNIGTFEIIQILFLMLSLSIAIGMPLYGAYSDRKETLIFLESQGYTNSKLTGYKFFSCGQGDLFRDGFTAINSNGKKVSGVVCQGILKGKTVRFE